MGSHGQHNKQPRIRRAPDEAISICGNRSDSLAASANKLTTCGHADKLCTIDPGCCACTCAPGQYAWWHKQRVHRSSQPQQALGQLASAAATEKSRRSRAHVGYWVHQQQDTRLHPHSLHAKTSHAALQCCDNCRGWAGAPAKQGMPISAL